MLWRRRWRHTKPCRRLGGEEGGEQLSRSPFPRVRSRLAGAAEGLEYEKLQLCWGESQDSERQVPWNNECTGQESPNNGRSLNRLRAQLRFQCHVIFWKALTVPQQPFFLLQAPVCVASIFEAPAPYFIIYTLEGIWRYCFLCRKRKGVGRMGGGWGKHGLVSPL